ncbi:MAG TPA: HEPN domain-containing protein [Gemmatimonadaceae bacterium]
MRAASADTSLLDAITSALTASCSPRRIILYGSRARGDATEDSDFDIAVEVADGVEEGAVRRVVDTAVRGRRVAVDIYVCRPGDLERRGADPGWLDYDIVHDGTVLYESDDVPRLRRPSGVAEPPPDGWPSVDAWLERARRDLLVVDHEAARDEPLWDIIAFHAHQAAEKALKAALVRANRRPPRTHSLVSLLEALEQAGRATARLMNDCRLLEPYAVALRYPTKAPMPTAEEGRALVKAAKRIVASAASIGAHGHPA